MNKSPSRLKLLLAIFSLLLTILIWQRGLQQSFDRPSVSPQLALNQREIGFLAAPSLPTTIRPLLVGEDPKLELKQILQELPIDQMSNRERLLLVALEDSQDKRLALLEETFEEDELEKVRKNFLENLERRTTSKVSIGTVESLKIDPLLYRLSCLSTEGDVEICFDRRVSRINVLRLLLSQLIPLVATLLGIFLLLWQAWIFFKKSSPPWPEILALPVSTIDMVILVAGGFVVLGELITPLIALPIGEVLTQAISSPLKESIKVLVGYIAMTIPPLFILRKQITSLSENTLEGDFFQWGLSVFPKAALEAMKGWLMVMPVVLLISWLTTFFFGDPGGSNPLLEMVLSSRDFSALAILFFTTVFIAPLFEEFVFRGALLPVLLKEQGRVIAILVSALIFALAHLSVGETPPLFVLGIGLALMRLSTGRLLPCVLMHSLWNGVTFVNLLILSA